MTAKEYRELPWEDKENLSADIEITDITAEDILDSDIFDYVTKDITEYTAPYEYGEVKDGCL